MIHLYTWTTPNGHKVPIMLEEIGMPYEVHPVNIGKDQQFAPAFLNMSPNNNIPVILDDAAPGGPLAIFESGAILTYLAEKSGHLLASSGPARWQTLQWLHWQVGGLGPTLAQLGFFAVRAPEKAPLAIERFTNEADRLLGVLERRLTHVPYLAGNEYSIADIACYPWALAASTFLKDTLAESLKTKAQIARWLKAVGDRPAVQRGMQVIAST